MMKKEKNTKKNALLEIGDLRIRLQEAEETLAAIRRGEVDGLVISGPKGDQVFTLKGADRSYRFFVEAMNEGAVTLSFDGTILYCNDRFAEMVETPYQEIIGGSIYRFVSSPGVFEPALQKGKTDRSKTEILLKRRDNQQVPVSLSLNPMQEDEVPGVCMVATDLTEHMHKDRVLKKSEERLRELSCRLLAAHEEERKRIAGDIHDSLGSQLVQIKFAVEVFGKGIGEDDPEAKERLRNIVSMVQEAADECRRLQMDLRPAILDDLGISATLSWFCRRFQTIYPSVRIEKKTEIKEDQVPGLLKTVIFRVAQEAMNNIAKHGNANLICLSLNDAGKGIELQITDNGTGFDAQEMLARDVSRRGLGLESMRERTELAGGSFTLESVKGKGTTVRHGLFESIYLVTEKDDLSFLTPQSRGERSF